MIVGLMPQTGTPVPSCHLYMDDAEYENGTFRLNNITNSGYIFDGEITLMAEKDATEYTRPHAKPDKKNGKKYGKTPMPQKNFTSKYSRTALPNGTPPAGKP